MPLRRCTDASAATWLTSSEAPWDRLVSLGPPGFESYARLLFLPDPLYAGQAEHEVVVDEGLPSEHELLESAVQVLTQHTGTPDDAYFCLWQGWGFDHDSSGDIGRLVDVAKGEDAVGGEADPHAVPGLAPTSSPPWARPDVVLPNRSYYLFRGSLSDFGDWDDADLTRGHGPVPLPDPAFIWPADRAWCVANDVDPHYAGIGASPAAIERLLAEPGLEVVRAEPGIEPPHYR